ncbi:MAG: transcriptional regulator, partial [Chloroflexi bacterium]|nr:transcriptional regulator [Chloroflexota bacterium]
KKARHLLQLLLIHRDRFLHREQIIEQLWPDASPAAVENQFKVALNALQRALEPHRPRSAQPFFVQRRGAAYGLNPVAAMELDAELFESQLNQAERLRDEQPEQAATCFRRALSLYQGDFLPEALYEAWSEEERRRLRLRFLRGAETLARLLLPAHPQESAQWCERILALDPAWEPAYRLLMRAYAAGGQRHLLARTYRRCIETLREELGLPPSPETATLYVSLTM